MACPSHQRRLARGAARFGHAAQACGVRDAARRGAAGLDRRDARRAAQRRGARPREEIHREVRGRGEVKFWLSKTLLPALALFASVAAAHEMSMAEMELRQISRGEFVWQWTASGSRPASEDLKPLWPEGCGVAKDQEGNESNLLRCG